MCGCEVTTQPGSIDNSDFQCGKAPGRPHYRTIGMLEEFIEPNNQSCVVSDVLVIDAPKGIWRGGVTNDTRYIVSHAEGTLGPCEFSRGAYMCEHVMHACRFRRFVFYSLG